VTNSEKERHLEMMKYPVLWPHDILPLKRRTKETWPEPGFLVDNRPIIYKANIFELPDTLKEIEREEFNSHEELMEAGWEID